MNEGEKVYLNKFFVSLSVPAIDMHLKLQDRRLSAEARQLRGLLVHEMSPGSAAIIFIQTLIYARKIHIFFIVLKY